MKIILLATLFLIGAQANAQMVWKHSNLQEVFEVQNGPSVSPQSEQFNLMPLFIAGFDKTPVLAIIGLNESADLVQAFTQGLPAQSMAANNIEQAQLQKDIEQVFKDFGGGTRNKVFKLPSAQNKAWKAMRENGWDSGLANLKVTLQATSVFRELRSDYTFHVGEGGDVGYTCQYGIEQVFALEIVDIGWTDGRDSLPLQSLIGSRFEGMKFTHLDPVRTTVLRRGTSDSNLINKFEENCKRNAN